ncbi:MAG: Rpn family recombination-promoting nuclease/putative transposase [Azoarcus sp.]|nr:Rpn family recombination-promoting nuclease/putative transposase [Azoarcus sp.]
MFFVLCLGVPRGFFFPHNVNFARVYTPTLRWTRGFRCGFYDYDYSDGRGSANRHGGGSDGPLHDMRENPRCVLPEGWNAGKISSSFRRDTRLMPHPSTPHDAPFKKFPGHPDTARDLKIGKAFIREIPGIREELDDGLYSLWWYSTKIGYINLEQYAVSVGKSV